MLTETQLAQLVQDFYDTVLKRENAIRLRGGFLDDDQVKARAAYYADLATDTRQSLAANRLYDSQIVTEALLRKHRVPLDELTPEDWNYARQVMLRAGIDLAEALQARYSGNFNHEPTDKLLKLNRDVNALSAGHLADGLYKATSDIRAAESTPSEAVTPVTTGQLLTKLAPIFLENQVSTGAWEKQSAAQASATIRLFTEICGDKPIKSYTRKEAGLFKDTLHRLPSDYGKAALFKGLSARRVIEANADRPANARSAPLTIKTIKRHFSAVSTMWQTALSRGEVEENIFSGFRFGGAQKAAVDQRSMWETEELAKLFSTPVWTGCLSSSRRSEPGRHLFRDEKFWLPLIAVFSGMRQEEICQLRHEDVRQEEGIWFFDINGRGTRKVKNATAVRLVPIHDELLRLGILRLITPSGATQSLMFPLLKPGGSDGRFGHGYTKWFTRYRRDVGLYRRGLDFHSFRHSATTIMHSAGVEDSVVDRLTGHATPGETARYTKKTSLQQLKNAIDKIDLRLDLTRLHVSR